MCLSNPNQGIPSATVTASHMTQGTIQYESMISQGMDEGLDLWEANNEKGETVADEVTYKLLSDDIVCLVNGLELK